MKVHNVTELVKASLKVESECSLSYQRGIKLNSFNHIKKTKVKFSGFILSQLRFFYRLLRNIRFSKRNLTSTNSVVIYAGTNNQLVSLKPTMRSLEEANINYTLIAPDDISFEGVNDKLTLSECCIALWVYLRHSPKLYYLLKGESKKLELKSFFYNYCLSYINLTYFSSVLLDLKEDKHIKLVIMANDHNSPNRCLRLISELLDIKTLYMQHASVSNLFPPLQYDYALLDGQVAYEAYKNCDSNLPDVAPYPVNVFLSGQKKEIKVKHKNNKFDVGLAVNTLDDINDVYKLVEKIPNLKIVIRTHPGQKQSFLEGVLKLTYKNNIDWCDPKEVSLSDFFASIECLIASNSSIHLEAALANIATFYYEFSRNVNVPDYYGYVKNGIATQLDIESVGMLINKFKSLDGFTSKPEAIQHYSATFNTKWEHNEGALVATLVERIINGKDFGDIYDSPLQESNYKVYKLKTK
jgi:hypothetical protein